MRRRRLDARIGALLDTPGAETLSAARTAVAQFAGAVHAPPRVYRFGNAIVDDWEGKVNAWPLDEGLIDYVDPGYGAASDENPAGTSPTSSVHDMGRGPRGSPRGRCRLRTGVAHSAPLGDRVGPSRSAATPASCTTAAPGACLEAVLWHGGEAEAAPGGGGAHERRRARSAPRLHALALVPTPALGLLRVCRGIQGQRHASKTTDKHAARAPQSWWWCSVPLRILPVSPAGDG